MSENTWDSLRSARNKKASLRERLAERRKERENIQANVLALGNTDGVPAVSSENKDNSQKNETLSSTAAQDSVNIASSVVDTLEADVQEETVKHLTDFEKSSIENYLLSELSEDVKFPVHADHLSSMVLQNTKIVHSKTAITDLLQKFEAQGLIITQISKENMNDVAVQSVDHEKLTLVAQANGISRKRKKNDGSDNAAVKKLKTGAELNIETLLASDTAKERENKKMHEEIQQLLSAASAKERIMSEKFRSQGGAMREFCPHGTKLECRLISSTCEKVHFRKLLHPHTDVNLGDCSFLNTCFHMDTCKYVHYEVDQDDLNRVKQKNMSKAISQLKKQHNMGDFRMMSSQWVQCDLRTFDMSVLGKFSVVMADPPWDIHMELPYGTMSDDEMRSLNVPTLQDDGYIFLWVTGRAMELGRECLELWGYRRCDELIWVKTNQLQKLIRTGRTGHWLNHGKEHCLIGVKGNPQNMNKGMDCDVIVAEVRATSHKPDEVYGMIERLSPGTRKIELFGRPHNVQPNWITLGNQCDGVQLHEEDVKRNYRKRYPDGHEMGGVKIGDTSTNSSS